MSALTMLDVLIGLVTIYMVMGIACTAVIEALSAGLKVRSVNLQIALQNMFAGTDADGVDFLTKFNRHPLIRSLSKKPSEKSSYSYVSGETVGHVVEQMVLGTEDDLQSALDKLPPDSPVRDLLESLRRQAEQEGQKFRDAVTKHFDNMMERTSGWYKRYTQKWSILIAAIFVIGTNADTVDLVRALSNNPAMRAVATDVAEKAIADGDGRKDEQSAAPDDKPIAGSAPVDIALDKTTDAVIAVKGAVFDFGLGRYNLPQDIGGWVSKVIGLLISIFAVSLGAPFWFDLLQRFMNVRTSVATNDEKNDEKSRSH